MLTPDFYTGFSLMIGIVVLLTIWAGSHDSVAKPSRRRSSRMSTNDISRVMVGEFVQLNRRMEIASLDTEMEKLMHRTLRRYEGSESLGTVGINTYVKQAIDSRSHRSGYVPTPVEKL